MRDVDDLKLQRRATMSLPWLQEILHGCEANLATRQEEAARRRQQTEEEQKVQARSLEEQIAAAVAAALRGCLKSPEMSVCDRCRATSEGAPIALCPLKSMLPIFTWTPFHAATETFQTASEGAGHREPYGEWRAAATRPTSARAHQ
jgi:hypothetical protein